MKRTRRLFSMFFYCVSQHTHIKWILFFLSFSCSFALFAFVPILEQIRDICLNSCNDVFKLVTPNVFNAKGVSEITGKLTKKYTNLKPHFHRDRRVVDCRIAVLRGSTGTGSFGHLQRNKNEQNHQFQLIQQREKLNCGDNDMRMFVYRVKMWMSKIYLRLSFATHR